MFQSSKNKSRVHTIHTTHKANHIDLTNTDNSHETNSTYFTRQIDNKEQQILFYAITSNLQEIKRLVNSSNVNNCIDTKNKFTVLHYAVKNRGNDAIIEYLLSVGADPKIKQNEGLDSIDLSIESNYRYLINKILKKKDEELDIIYNKLDEVRWECKNLDEKNKHLIDTNNYINKSIELNINKTESAISENKILKLENNVLKQENEHLKLENNSLKRKFKNSEDAFENLLRKTKK